MEDLKKLDDEIVRCAEEFVDLLERISHASAFPVAQGKLTQAIAAKRSASRPKLLSAEEAGRIADAAYEADENEHIYSLQAAAAAVLDADRASILKVIEGLPDSGHPTEKWVRVDDICSALSTRSS